MTARRMHIEPSDATDAQRALRVALCGWIAVDTTRDADKVTCVRCQRLHAKAVHERVGVRYGLEEAVRDIAALIAGPPVGVPYPALTPETWHAMRCRDGRRCSCAYCRADAANASALRAWEASQQLRPHRRWECTFGSVGAALEHVVRWRRDGATARSSHGSAQSRALETMRLGAVVQTTQRTREDVTTRDATHAVDVERACAWAYREASERRGLPQAVCVEVLLASVVSGGPSPGEWAERLGVSEAVVRGVVRHGRRVVAERLAADGYVPMPRRRVA